MWYKNLILLVIVLLSFGKVFAKSCNYTEQAQNFNKLIQDSRNYQIVIGNVLDFNLEEFKLYLEKIQANDKAYDSLLQKYIEDSVKLNALCNAKSGILDIYIQKKVVNKRKKDIYNFQKKEMLEIRNKLNSEKRKIYNVLKKLEKRDMKKNSDISEYYKKNPHCPKFIDIGQ